MLTAGLAVAVALLVAQDRRELVRPLAIAVGATVLIGGGVAYDLIERNRSFGGTQNSAAYLASKVDLDLLVRDLTIPFTAVGLAAVVAALFVVRDRRTVLPFLCLAAVVAALAYSWLVDLPLAYTRMAYYLPLALVPLIAAIVPTFRRRTLAGVVALALAAVTAVAAWSQADDVRRYYQFADAASLRGLGHLSSALRPDEVVVTDRCWSFLGTWLLSTPTLAALDPPDIQPKAELPFARQARAVLRGTPRGTRGDRATRHPLRDRRSHLHSRQWHGQRATAGRPAGVREHAPGGPAHRRRLTGVGWVHEPTGQGGHSRCWRASRSRCCARIMASAATPVRALSDDLAFTDSSPEPRALAFATARRAGARVVRITLDWSRVAPEGSVKPPGFRAADPADPGYRWGYVEDAVRDAAARHLRVLLVIDRAPAWAGERKPDPGELGAFARAAARRFSGFYPDPKGSGNGLTRSGRSLPRVRWWQLWEAPNSGTTLQPADGAADHYRKMLDAVRPALRRISSENRLVTGGTTDDGAIAPLAFWRGCCACLRLHVPARLRFDVAAARPGPASPTDDGAASASGAWSESLCGSHGSGGRRRH